MDDHKEPRAELSSAVLRRLVLARFLYNQALENAVLRREVTEFAAINTLQDAIEVFFLAATDYLNVDLGKKTEFEQYIDKVNDRLGEKELPFRRRLIEINKVRVLSKHQGIPPNPSELMGYLQAAREFFDQAAALIFGRPFWAVSLVDLLPETDEAKGLLLLAERQFHGGDYSECLITCRKVMFIKYECRGSIEGYRDGRFSEPCAACFGVAAENTRSAPADLIFRICESMVGSETS
ncbi:hypothetical protein [Bradyrhizobium sp. SZCCHNPS2010]|uniref:hypothetical protein n=1 Tax=Bradyrhizobium sp. SZCCHNPS2010 TaxID=3057333 RepID=UPI002915EFC9|nr:hypothetical protein [Bradyrhizobium sp. SZCCHNPS2010]